MTLEQERGLRLWFDVCKNGQDLVEIRIFDPNRKNINYSGYFMDADTIIREIAPYENMNIYWTLNKIDESCFSRVQRNKILQSPPSTTSDNDIIGYDWILVDCDVERSANVSSTDEELAYAKKKANEIYAYLRDQNFSSPLCCTSGAGIHLLYKVQLKNNPERRKLVKDFLDALGMLFSDERVKIDGVVGNPSRICRLYNFTTNKKGANTKERPHRMAQFVRCPDEIKPTDPEYIEKVAALLPQKEVPTRENHYRGSDSFNLEEFLTKYNIKVAKKVETPQFTKYVLDQCPFAAEGEHLAPDSCVIDFKGGGFQFICLHNSHRHYNFRDFRLHFDAHAYDVSAYSEYVHKRNYYGMRKEFIPEPETEEKGKVWLTMGEVKKSEISMDDYIPTGIEPFDSMCIGIKRKSVSVWSGRRGCAKSTLMNQLILGGAQRGYKTALCTRELSEGETKQWLMLQASGKQFNLPSKFNGYWYTPNNVIQRIEPWIDQYLRLYSNAYSGDVLNIEDKVRSLYKEWPFDSLIIDNLMSVTISGLGEDSEWNNQKKFLQKLCDLAKELNIAIHLVAHPNKSNPNGWLNADMISGSGNIGNYAHNIFILSRIFPDTFANQAQGALSKKDIDDILQSQCTNIIEISKLRDKGAAVGKIIKLWFEIESNRLKADPYEVINYNWQETPRQISMDDLPSYEFDSPFSTPSDTFDPFAPADPNEPVPF